MDNNNTNYVKEKHYKYEYNKKQDNANNKYYKTSLYYDNKYNDCINNGNNNYKYEKVKSNYHKSHINIYNNYNYNNYSYNIQSNSFKKSNYNKKFNNHNCKKSNSFYNSENNKKVYYNTKRISYFNKHKHYNRYKSCIENKKNYYDYYDYYNNRKFYKRNKSNFSIRKESKSQNRKHSSIDYYRSRSKKSFSHKNSKSINSCCSYISKSTDAGHIKFLIGEYITKRYKILKHINDGTFGRVLECRKTSYCKDYDKEKNKTFAIKIIRPVKRYLEAAQIEINILKDINKNIPNSKLYYVNLVDYFNFKDDRYNYKAMVFEKLGLSLYEYIKSNNYYGFPIFVLKEIIKQVLKALHYLHTKVGLVHTDLKPENILLVSSNSLSYDNIDKLPENVVLKYNNTNIDDSKHNYKNKLNNLKKLVNYYKYPEKSDVRIIDFGGACYLNESHDGTINTRQYRSPEVILRCCNWNTKSDIWSLGCIFFELYYGDLLFPTHNDVEHLCMIEKNDNQGLPSWMIENKKMKENFKYNYLKNNQYIKICTMDLSLKLQENLKDFSSYNKIILEKDFLFKDFIKSMLTIDPKYRLSCLDLLNHEFLKT